MKPKMNVLVLGCTGMLGSTVSRYLSKNNEINLTLSSRKINDMGPIPKNIEVVEFDINHFSLDKLRSILSGKDYVINCIGLIQQKIEINKSKPSDFFLINSILPNLIDQIQPTLGCKIIQIGTDCVFDGKVGNYSETSSLNATDNYGLSKKLAEKNLSNSLVLRTSVVGLEDQYKLSLLEWFINQPRNSTVNGFRNHIWNGITTMHFAKIVEGIILNDSYFTGLQHVLPEGVISKYHLLKLFAKHFNREDVRIIEKEDHSYINRSLTTNSRERNIELWKLARYEIPPKIEFMIEELSKTKVST